MLSTNVAKEVTHVVIEVKVKNGNVNGALSRLKKKLLKDDLFKTLRDKRYYEKPSERKRRKKKEMTFNFKRNERIRRAKLDI